MLHFQDPFTLPKNSWQNATKHVVGQLAASVFLRHMNVRQVDVLCKHRRLTCMRDRDLCCKIPCKPHNLSIHRAARREAARRSVYFHPVRSARDLAA